MFTAFTPTCAAALPLLERVRRREPHAMDEVLRLHRKDLLRRIDRIVGDPWAAEDILQEVLVRLFTHAGTLHSAANLDSWLRSVARNLARTHLRERRRSIVARRSGPDESPTPDHVVAERETVGRVLHAVDDLDEPFRTTFRLCALDGADYASAAATLGCNKTTVNTRMFRTWRRLRAVVRE